LNSATGFLKKPVGLLPGLEKAEKLVAAQDGRNVAEQPRTFPRWPRWRIAFGIQPNRAIITFVSMQAAVEGVTNER